VKGRAPRIDTQITVADGPAEERACGHCAQEGEKIELGLLCGQLEFLNEEESVIALQPLDIDELAEQQRPYDHEGDHQPLAGQRWLGNGCLGAAGRLALMLGVPATDITEKHHAERRYGQEIEHARLAQRQEDERGGKWAQSSAGIATHLE